MRRPAFFVHLARCERAKCSENISKLCRTDLDTSVLWQLRPAAAEAVEVESWVGAIVSIAAEGLMLADHRTRIRVGGRVAGDAALAGAVSPGCARCSRAHEGRDGSSHDKQ